MTVTEPRRPGAARARLLSAALGLYAEHGVSGTSLQMIADELGVTKAAVYHQFRTKEEIVLAVLDPALEELARVADAAEAQRTRAARLDATLTGLVELIVRHRRLAALLHADPAVHRILGEHPAMHGLADRVGRLLAGPDPDVGTRVAVAVVGGALMTVGADPTLADVDDDALGHHLLATARRVLGVRTPPRPPSR